MDANKFANVVENAYLCRSKTKGQRVMEIVKKYKLFSFDYCIYEK
jgi:hypothetical protein